MEVIYEDNHVIIVSKNSGEIVQGDKTGDVPLSEIVKQYIKESCCKPGNVFLGVVHRLDRPVAGLVVFARTSKALTRLNDMFRRGEVEKTYWAITKNAPPQPEGELIHWLTRNEKQNKSYVVAPPRNADADSIAHGYGKETGSIGGLAKKAVLRYRLLARSENYHLLEVRLLTGRHHQIRCQLSAIGCPIKGDLKYGAKRSNPDGSISLQSHRVEFEHPVSHETIIIEAPLPHDTLWQAIAQNH